MSSIVKKSLFHIPTLFLPALVAMAGFSASCNSKSDSTSEDVAVVTMSNVAVKEFSLKADTKVIANLDSVFFSIDLNNGVIFNADSLPLGTKVSRLIPVITFSSDMKKAELIVDDGVKTDTINYLTNSTDSIDFSHKVTLDVTSYDGITNYSYLIKVNVHTQKPDSIMWDKLAVSALPARLANPVEQKTVDFDDKAYSIIKESDNSLTLAISSDLFNHGWQKASLTLPFTPELTSLCSTPEALWMLDTDGNLYTSANGSDWQKTSESGWVSIIGAYSDSVLGLKNTDSGLAHCHYPASDIISDPLVDPEFPIYDRSELLSISNRWAPQPTAMFVGGKTPTGESSSATWAFDGSSWVKLSEGGIPAVESPMFFRYVYYWNASTTSLGDPREIWVMLGGRLADGTINPDVYFSPDNGVTWKKAGEYMQLPDYFPALYGANVVTMAHELSDDLTDAWTRTKTRAYSAWLTPEYEIDGTMISWKCPYIYIFGGTDTAGNLSDTIWRGVLARLTFQPII